MNRLIVKIICRLIDDKKNNSPCRITLLKFNLDWLFLCLRLLALDWLDERYQEVTPAGGSLRSRARRLTLCRHSSEAKSALLISVYHGTAHTQAVC